MWYHVHGGHCIAGCAWTPSLGFSTGCSTTGLQLELADYNRTTTGAGRLLQPDYNWRAPDAKTPTRKQLKTAAEPKITRPI